MFDLLIILYMKCALIREKGKRKEKEKEKKIEKEKEKKGRRSP